MKNSILKQIIICIAMILILSLGHSEDVKAEEIVSISTGSMVTDSLKTSDDCVKYKFKVTSRSVTYFKFGIKNKDDEELAKSGWKLTLYKDNDKVKVYEEIVSMKNLPRIGLDEGTYYLEVSAMCPDDYSAPIECEYGLRLYNVSTNRWEVEANNTKAAATKIKTDNDYYGVLHNESDVDWYQVNVEKQGYIKLDFSIRDTGNMDTIRNGWTVNLRYSNNNIYKTYYFDAESATSTVKMPVEKGKYYIEVRAKEQNIYDAPIDCEYSFNVKNSSNANWEIEKNNTKAKATTINMGKKYYGILHNESDVDYYKVNVTKTGYIKLNFGMQDAYNIDDIHEGWNVRLYYSNGKLYNTYEFVYNDTTSIIPVEKGAYYIIIEAKEQNIYDAPIDCGYYLKVNNTESSSWESECNDTKTKADSVLLNKTYRGNMYSEADVDYFKVKVNASGKLKIALKPNDSAETECGWRVTLYKGFEKVDSWSGISVATKTINVTKGTYYIKIEAKEHNVYDAPIEETYKLSTTYTPSKPSTATIKSVTAGTKKVTLKWNKVSNATGYQIWRKQGSSGEWKLVKTIKNSSVDGSVVTYTNTALKSEKTYYYKVRTYNEAHGKITYGNMSEVKVVKTK